MERNKKMNGFISIIMVLALVFTNFTISNVRLSADEINIIEISTAEELAKIGNDENYPLDGNYKLTADIENVTTTIGQGTDTYPSVFTGSIDGDGHTVTLNIQAAKTYQGLIGWTDGATIKNLVVKGQITSTLGWIAGITPKAVNTTIENCGSQVNISTTGNNMSNLAGIAGYAENTTITNCYNAGSISGKIKNAGGITGQIKTYALIENCYNTGDISTTATSAPRVGGVIGYGYPSSGKEAKVLKCYNSGVVTGTVQTGAFIGYINEYLTADQCYYLDGTHENAFGFQFNADTTKILSVSGQELEALALELGDAFTSDPTINNGYPILKWQVNTDEEDKALLESLVSELPSGVIAPKFKKDKNINTYISELIEAKEDYAGKGIIVSVKNVENRFSDTNTYIEQDGTIHYFYTDLFETGSAYRYYGQADITFNLTLNNITVEYAPRCVNVYWDLDKVESDLNTISDEYIEEQILGENESLDAITETLKLPVYPNIQHNDKEKNIKWVSTKYTSSDSSVIAIGDTSSWDSDFTNMYYTANVYRGSEDKEVIITAEFTFERYTMNSGEDTVTETIKREIPVKVLAYNEELEQTKELQEKLTTYEDKLTDFTLGGELDLSNVKNDIQLVIPRNLGLDGKYYDMQVESSDSSVVEVYGYRTYTYRPLPGEDAKDVTLTVTITSKENPNITASTEINLTVVPLTEEEINAAVSFMEKAKDSFFTFIKNENTDESNITGDLKTFYGIYLDENGNVYASDYVSKPNNNGILARIVNPDEEIPDNQRYWISDNTSVIEDQALRVTLPEYNTKVTVGAVISHEVYENYARRYADDPVYGDTFQALNDQKVTVTLTVIGEKGEEPTTETITEKPTENVTPSETETATKSEVNTTTKKVDTSVYKKLKVTRFRAKVVKKSIKLTWKKNKKASGYQIKYWQSKKAKKAKKVLVKKSKKMVKIKGLKKGKKYIFIMRTYKIVNGKKIYGKWTKKRKKIMK